MSLRDRANGHAKAHGQPCAFGVSLQALDGSDRAEVIDCVNDYEVNLKGLAIELGALGVEVSFTRLQNHRTHSCKWCARNDLFPSEG